MRDSIVRLDAQAVRASVQVVSGISDADLAKPTPCAGWTLADLLAHMTVQHEGFAAAAAGEGANLDLWRPKPRNRDTPSTLVKEYASAADRVLDAFAADGVLDREFSLPEISTRTTFPGRQAIAFHFVDYVTHGWDVARSLGLGYDLDPDVLDAAHQVARAVPDDERRLRPGAAFAPGIPVDPDRAMLERVVALLGRRPEWPALP
jgi:uncharacterized protein (TIGR03086 family)